MLADKHDNNFDLIRLLAALQVAFSHTFWWLQVPLPREVDLLLKCFPGVPVFFVVSGFLITRSYLSRQRGLWAYLGSRALRIYPALWLQYLLVIVLLALTGGFAVSLLLEPIFWKWLLSAMFIGSNFYGNLVANWGPFTWTGLYQSYPADVLWTIPVELGFYLLVPLVLSRTLARLKLTPWLILLCFGGSLAYAMHVGPMLLNQPTASSTGMIHSSPLPYFWLFLTGATIAIYWERLKVFFVGRAAWWLLAWAVITGLYFLKTGTTAVRYRIPELDIALRALLLAGVVLGLAHSWPQLSGWMRGHDLSYGLYLFHMPLPLGLYYAGMTGQAWLAWASLLVAFVLAALSWTLVEAPALRLRPHLSQAHFGLRLPRVSVTDLRRWRPQLLGVTALMVASLIALAVSRSALLDLRGPSALEHFFGKDSGLLVQPYQTPDLALHRGDLQISSDIGPAGLGLVVEPRQQGTRKLELVGRQLGPQPVSGRLTLDDQPSSYFRMPDGPFSLTVEPNKRVELLIYADVPFAYAVEKASLTACSDCVIEDQQTAGLAAAQRFFGKGSGLVVQPYQSPVLRLLRGSLEISSETAPAGLGLVVDASQEGTRKLELTGHQLGDQAVSGRLTIDDQPSTYFRMPDGPLSVTVAPGSRVELLIYADQQFSYQLEKFSLAACEGCTTNAQMMARIKQDIPALNQSTEVARHPDGLVAAAQLMHWLSPRLVIENDETLHPVMSGLPLGQILSESFEAKRNGASCGGFAVFQARLLRMFGYEAFTMDFGMPGTFTHVTTVVAIGSEDAKRFYIFDPTFNAGLVTVADRMQLDLGEALALPASDVRLHSPKEAVRDLLLPLDSSVAAAVQAGGSCSIKDGRQLCRNVDQVSLMLDPVRARLKRQGIEGPDIWLDLLRKGVISITGAEPETRDALIKVLTTHNVAYSERA
ncbi:acyltransferase [Pseudomonas otitidis]|uniref:acyltransferase family protein n=1 Tax=Metapseudomonas otitidis TaxID=319939 RepID=UPI0024483A21|nr:acyltransferase [Pseudomonas otitidis]MDH1109241.1 acyltransferase [Pseudomonas otitidis]MDH1159991.1 acyltransferase [Pseudomonas otitidis]MDH1167401.1 acyltransferase [Pseudomonas otitidis]